jgi:hypothetical protein
MVYSALFDNVFEALNLILEKYLRRNPICLPISLSFSPYHRVLEWLAVGDFPHII